MSERLESGSAADDTAGWVDQCYRLALSRRALRLAALFFAFFILVDLFLTGYLIHAAVEALALAMVMFAALLLRDPDHLGLAQLLGTVAVAMTILVVIISGVARDGVLVWLALFPPIPFYLGGLSCGLRLSAVFAAIVLPVLAVAIMIDAPVGLSWVALVNAGGALLGSAAIAYLYEQSRGEAQQRLSAAANTDPLTGVSNRRGFLQGFDVRRRVAQRARRPLSLLLFDLDNLKQINDANGHAAGDAAIRHIAKLVASQIREQDHLGRIGGDEFALVLPNTGLEGALTLAAKLRGSLREQPLMLDNTQLTLSLSIGAAEAGDIDHIDVDRLLGAADRQLYAVKQRGRNGQQGVRLSR